MASGSSFANLSFEFDFIIVDIAWEPVFPLELNFNSKKNSSSFLIVSVLSLKDVQRQSDLTYSIIK